MIKNKFQHFVGAASATAGERNARFVSEDLVLWPLVEMLRRRVIAFLVEKELLPRERAEMLLF